MHKHTSSFYLNRRLALLDVGLEEIAAHEAERFARLLDGLHEIDGVRVVGPQDTADRAPTLMFEVAGKSPAAVAELLADAQVAVWDGHNYAVEAMVPLGLDAEDGAVRVFCTDMDAHKIHVLRLTHSERWREKRREAIEEARARRELRGDSAATCFCSSASPSRIASPSRQSSRR